MKKLILPALFAGLALGTLPATSIAGDCGSGSAKKKAQPVARNLVETAVEAGSFNTLVAAVKAAGLADTLSGPGPFTVFAPSDAAFAKLPDGTVEGLLADKAKLKQVLTYHVVAGKVPASAAMNLQWADTVQGQALRVTRKDGSVFVDGAKVIKADIKTSNGIIHVIDSVVLPRKDIVDTAVAAGSFKTLVTAVKAAGLVETLKGKGPFTVFAPADSAFAKLPDGTVASLLEDKAELTKVLTYHVVSGRILSSDLRVGTANVKTVQGQTVAVTRAKDGSVTVDGAKVVSADILGGNGVIHVIDTVIMPAAPGTPR